MSKWFEITATTHKTYAVEVEDTETIDDAKQFVKDDMFGDCTIDDAWELKDESAIKTARVCSDDQITLR